MSRIEFSFFFFFELKEEKKKQAELERIILEKGTLDLVGYLVIMII